MLFNSAPLEPCSRSCENSSSSSNGEQNACCYYGSRRLELCATLCCEKRKHNKHYAYDTISLRVKGGSNANTHLPFNSGSGAPIGGAVLRARLSCAQATVCGNGPCEAACFALPLRTPAPTWRTLGYAPPYNRTDARRAVL